jgi:DNA-binding transcriptional LysR family regulator
VNLLAAEAFVAVVNLGSLQKAAARLGVSSATISRRLTELENELGVRLVERTTRSLRVTELGRAFHDQCTRGLDTLADAHDLVASSEARIAGTVRISSPPNIGPLLLGAIAKVRTAHPEIHVVLVETERRLDQRNDDIDLFVRGGEVSDERLVARTLVTYPHVLVSSREYMSRAGAPVTPADLETHQIIVFGGRRRFAGWDLMPVRGGASVHIDVRPGFSSNDYATIAHAVRSGMGIAELPAILYEQRASLVRILPKWALHDITLKLLFASDRLLSKAVRAVIDAIMAMVPEQARKAVSGAMTNGYAPLSARSSERRTGGSRASAKRRS